MLKLNFYSFGEKKPKCGQQIIYLKRGYSFDAEYFEPRETMVECQWTQLEDGEECGSAICYEKGTSKPKDEVIDGVRVTYRLDIILDGFIPDNTWFWMPIEKYWAAFDKAVDNNS